MAILSIDLDGQTGYTSWDNSEPVTVAFSRTTECRVLKNSNEREESLPQPSMQRNRGKQQNGKTRDLLKKIRDTKGKFHAKMGSIKDRNGMDLTEAEAIKKRWQ